MSAPRETVGVISTHSNHNGNHYDSEIAAKAQEQRNLRLCISNCKNDKLKVGLKQKWNQLQHEIRWLALNRVIAILGARAAEVEKHKDGAQMFSAMKQLIPRPWQNLIVHDSNDRILINTLCNIKIVSQWFQSQFSPPVVQGIRSADVPSGPLACPISELEVENTLHHLNNNQACGPDGVHKELVEILCWSCFYHTGKRIQSGTTGRAIIGLRQRHPDPSADTWQGERPTH